MRTWAVVPGMLRPYYRGRYAPLWVLHRMIALVGIAARMLLLTYARLPLHRPLGVLLHRAQKLGTLCTSSYSALCANTLGVCEGGGHWSALPLFCDGKVVARL